MKKELNSAIDVLARRLITDYQIKDPDLARQIGERAANILGGATLDLTQESIPNIEGSRNKIFSRVMFHHSVINQFSADKINKAIGVIEEHASSILSWPEGFSVQFKVGDRSYYDGSSETTVYVMIAYRDGDNNEHKISRWVSDLYKADLSKIVAEQILHLNGIAKIAGGASLV